jgi:hypothetical protein
MCPQDQVIMQRHDYAPVNAWLASLEREFPNVTVCRPVFLWYDGALCWDHSHLNTDGVAKFMPVVAKDVQAALAN